MLFGEDDEEDYVKPSADMLRLGDLVTLDLKDINTQESITTIKDSTCLVLVCDLTNSNHVDH